MILTTDQRVKLRLAELEILVLDQQRIIEELQANESQSAIDRLKTMKEESDRVHRPSDKDLANLTVEEKIQKSINDRPIL